VRKSSHLRNRANSRRIGDDERDERARRPRCWAYKLISCLRFADFRPARRTARDLRTTATGSLDRKICPAPVQISIAWALEESKQLICIHPRAELRVDVYFARISKTTFPTGERASPWQWQRSSKLRLYLPASLSELSLTCTRLDMKSVPRCAPSIADVTCTRTCAHKRTLGVSGFRV